MGVLHAEQLLLLDTHFDVEMCTGDSQWLYLESSLFIRNTVLTQRDTIENRSDQNEHLSRMDSGC